MADFSPNPTGVAKGPLRAILLRAMEAIVSSGTPLDNPFLKTSAPASQSSQVILTPAASMILRVAVIISGPTPSPGEHRRDRGVARRLRRRPRLRRLTVLVGRGPHPVTPLPSGSRAGTP